MKKNYTGLFITLEGGDKTGKSTQAKILKDQLTEQGNSVVLTREPGGSAIGAEIRKILMDPTLKLSKATSMLLFQADRAQHYKEVIKPALKRGKIVICDRYVDSTIVYQGHLEGWNLPLLFRLHGVATGMLMPDITFVLDGTPLAELGSDTYDSKGAEYSQRIREKYLQLASTNARYIVINANQPVEQVTEELMTHTIRKYTSKCGSAS